MAEQFEFSDAERRDPLWNRIKAFLEGRLQSHRLDNDNNKSPEDTAKLRGRIAELKYLLDLDRRVEHVPAEPGD